MLHNPNKTIHAEVIGAPKDHLGLGIPKSALRSDSWVETEMNDLGFNGRADATVRIFGHIYDAVWIYYDPGGRHLMGVDDRIRAVAAKWRRICRGAVPVVYGYQEAKFYQHGLWCVGDKSYADRPAIYYWFYHFQRVHMDDILDYGVGSSDPIVDIYYNDGSGDTRRENLKASPFSAVRRMPSSCAIKRHLWRFNPGFDVAEFIRNVDQQRFASAVPTFAAFIHAFDERMSKWTGAPAGSPEEKCAQAAAVEAAVEWYCINRW